MRLTIIIMNTNMFRSGTIANKIGYSSVLPDISEAEAINQSYDHPHNESMTHNIVLYFGCI